jgi:hypothetical protein
MLPLHAFFAAAGIGVGMAAANFSESVGGHENFKNTEFRAGIQKQERRAYSA